MSSILSSILGGHGAPPPLPPDIMSAIGKGAPDAEDAAEDKGKDPAALLSDALDTLAQYLKVEPDEADKATVATCIANLQKVRAKDQQEADGALQGKTTPRLMRKAGSSAGGSTGGGGY